MKRVKTAPICGVYQIKNTVNGKMYIGQSRNIKKRWIAHNTGKGNVILRNAILKHGIDKFEYNIIEIVDTEGKTIPEIIKILTELEQKWFDYFDPFFDNNKGYNISKISKPNIGGKRSDEYCDKISKIQIELNYANKPLKQYDMNGIFIRNWKSAAEVERQLNYYAENISACCLGKQYSSNHFIWKHADYELKIEDIIQANKSLRMSEVRQYNLKGELLGTFKNIKEASKLTYIKETIIRDSANGNRKTGAGFIWKFKNQGMVLIEHINKKDYQIRQLTLNGDLIKIWDNVGEVIKKFSLNKYSAKEIYKVCEGVKKQSYKYKWEYVHIPDAYCAVRGQMNKTSDWVIKIEKENIE